MLLIIYPFILLPIHFSCLHHWNELHFFFCPASLSQEATLGPSFLRSLAPVEESEEVSSQCDEDSNSVVEGREEDDEIDMEKLRAYELEKLRYYYAVAEFSSAQAALHVYIECDGLEIERTGNVLDCRFIPDETSFKGDEPRDIATEIPSNYQRLDFKTKALQSSAVELTWDLPDAKRSNLLQRRAFDNDDLKSDDIRAYLASSASENEDNEDNSLHGDDSDEEAHIKEEKVCFPPFSFAHFSSCFSLLIVSIFPLLSSSLVYPLTSFMLPCMRYAEEEVCCFVSGNSGLSIVVFRRC